MKKAILLLVCLLTTAVAQVFSQPMNRMGFDTPGVQQLIAQYGDELQLSDEQKNQLIALQMEHRKQFQAYKRPNNGRGRGNFRGDRSNSKRGYMRGPGYSHPGFGAVNWETRLEMRNEMLNILTEDQKEFLRNKWIGQAEGAHEFRTLRHEYIVSEAGIKGDKAEQVLALLKAQSESHLDMAKQRITNPDEVTLGQLEERFQQMRNTDDELRNILTVDEYENLRQNMGFGYGHRFADRSQKNWGRGRGYRMWNR